MENFEKVQKEEYSTIKVTILQAESKGAKVVKFLDDELTAISSRERKPDLVILPEHWIDRVVAITGPITNEVIQENKFLRSLSEIIQKHSVYAVLGTLSEFCDKKRYITTLFLKPDGQIQGTYRKRRLTSVGAHEIGNEIGMFECDFGKAALMICVDVENDDIMKENLNLHPNIIFNPTFIPAPSTQNIPDLFLSDWRIGMETMSRKFETTCTSNNLVLVRCDAPSTAGALGSSQVITPYATFYTPTHMPNTFSVFVDKKLLKHTRRPSVEETSSSLVRSLSSEFTDNYFPSVTKVCTQTRSAEVDNTGSRYTVHSYSGHTSSIHHVSFLDNMRVASASKDGTVRIWNVHRKKCLQVLAAQDQGDSIVLSTTFSKDQNQVFGSLSKRNAIAAWNLTDPDPLICQVVATRTRMSKLLMKDNTSNSIYCIGVDGSISNLDPRSFSLSNIVESDTFGGAVIRDCITSSRDNVLQVGVGSRVIEVDTRMPNAYLELYKAEKEVNSIAELKEDTLLFATNGHVYSLNTTSKSIGRSFQSHGVVTSIAPVSERHFLSSNTEGTFELWNSDLVNENPLHIFYGHTMSIYNMKFDSSHNVITCGEEDTWKMWTFTQNRLPVPLRDLIV